MARNPFALIEKIGRIAVYVLVGLFFAFCIYVVGFVAVREWGWGALWLIPGVPVGLFLIALVSGLLRLLCDVVHDRWIMAKWRWDDRHS